MSGDQNPQPPADLHGHRQTITPEEFREFGYLQEANRQFFHPLGLALGVHVGGADDERSFLVFDSRDDPEGFVFAPDPEGVETDRAKAARVATEWEARAAVRLKAFGYVVQPVPDGGSPDA